LALLMSLETSISDRPCSSARWNARRANWELVSPPTAPSTTDAPFRVA
jgi:hypothetical protein